MAAPVYIDRSAMDATHTINEDQMSEVDEKILQHSKDCDLREDTKKMRKQMDDIHGLFFGSYNKRTGFRQ